MVKERDKDGTDGWWVSNTVPLGLVFLLIGHIAAIVWLASSVNSKVIENERRIVSLEASDDVLFSADHQLGLKLARVEEKIDAQNNTLQRIENGVDFNNKVFELYLDKGKSNNKMENHPPPNS